MSLCEACQSASPVIHMDRLCCIGRFLATLANDEQEESTSKRWAQLYPYTVDDMRQSATAYRKFKRGF